MTVFRHPDLHCEATYDLYGANYRLVPRRAPEAALWLTLPKHSPVARIDLFELPSLSAQERQRVADTLLSQAQVLARRSKAKQMLRVTPKPEVVDFLKAAGFKRLTGQDYALDLLHPLT